jgi:MacB-like periplasmic core domain
MTYGISYPNFRDLPSKSHSFDGMIAYQTSTLGISASSKTLPQVRYGVIASGNFFETIGVQPVLGRAFLPDEDKVPGRDAVVVLAYDFWQKELAKDPHVIGRILRIKGIEGIEFTVGGVALAPRRQAALDAKSADDAIAGGTVDSGRWYHPP